MSITDDDPATTDGDGATTDGDGGAEPTSEPTAAVDDDMPETGTGSTAVLAGLLLLAAVGILVRARSV